MAEVIRYDTESHFPDAVDDLLCLSDINLEQLPLSNHHQQLLENEQYTEAGRYLESMPLDSMCASLFNLLENRIYTTQNHLSNKHSMWYEIHGEESPIECFDEPTDKTIKPVWTNIEDLSRVQIGSLSGGFILSANGGFRA